MTATPTAATRGMIVVLGMHRSGTSAVAGTLAQLGVEFSEHLIEPGPDNPKGYFEHADIWQQDHDILAALGSEWDDPLPLPADWQQAPVLAPAAKQMAEVLHRDFAASSLAGIKDPRMCRLMPAWREWLLDAGMVPLVVLVLRHPAEVCASLAKRDRLPAEQAAWVWLRHMLESEAATRDLPRVVLGYGDLLRDWRMHMSRVGAVLGVAWPCALDQAAPAVDAFLESALRHHREHSPTDSLAAPLGGWVERAWHALTQSEVDIGALDTIAAEVAAADRAAAASAHVLRLARLRRAELERSLQWCDGERRDMVAGNAQLQANLERHVAELADTKRGSELLQDNLDRHIEELARTRDHVQSLQDNLERHTSQISAMASEIAALQASRDSLEATLAAVYVSRSWRLTRPLRGAARLARRLRDRLRLSLTDRDEMAAAAELSPLAATDVSTSARDPEAILAATFAVATGPRILIVTPDILGPIRNGGIGTAFGALARTLARNGHAVTVLYTLGGHSEDGNGIEPWQRHYAALGVQFIPVWLERGEPVLDAPHHAWRAYRVYLWLKAHQGDYDLAYFPEWKGESYYALQAKRLGLDFAALRMIVVTHSSTTWAESGNYMLPRQFDDLLLEYMERRSTEMADAVISPSTYMLQWMGEHGWKVSAPTYVIQNLMPDGVQPSPERPAAEITEWVFFGRLERRKGLFVFLDALARVPQDMRQRIRVTFLGKAIRTPGFDSRDAIADKLSAWPAVKLITDYDRDQALDYLQQPGRVAIIASLVENSPYTVLECVLKRIPFIAADVGGIAELIHPDDRARALFKPVPGALLATLLALDGAGYASPRPAQPAQATEQRWLDLQQELLKHIPPRASQPAFPAPHITVCLVHYDRPWLLAQAIDSLRRQTWSDFDVVLVDDGSPSTAAQEYLDSLADEFAWRGWTIVRQANAYLGAARNNAVRHARGDYVMFMDDDNLAKPEELAVFAHAAACSGADILTTVSDIFADVDAAAGPPASSRQLWIPLGGAAGLGVFRNVFGDANALVRKATFESLGGFTEDYGVGHEDWEFFARAVLAGANLQLVPEPLFWYRVNASSMLRAGHADIDHARSVRPYYEGMDRGIGPVLAYASWMQRRPSASAVAAETGAMPAPLSRRTRLRIAATGLWHGETRARLHTMLRQSGWRATARQLVRYLGLRR